MAPRRTIEDEYIAYRKSFTEYLTRLLNSENILIEQNIQKQSETELEIEYVVGDAATNKCIYFLNYYKYLGDLKSYSCRLPDRNYAQLPAEAMKRQIADLTNAAFCRRVPVSTKPIIKDPTYLADQSLAQRIYNFGRTDEQKQIEDNIFTRISEMLEDSNFYFSKIRPEDICSSIRIETYVAKKKNIPVRDYEKDETVFKINKNGYKEFSYSGSFSGYFYNITLGDTDKYQPVSQYMAEKIYQEIQQKYKPENLCTRLQEFHDFLNDKTR